MHLLSRLLLTRLLASLLSSPIGLESLLEIRYSLLQILWM
jgi:hypothetical protein